MRILIVDDEPRLTRILKMAVENQALGDVVTANHADDALRVLRGGGCDVVVTDVRMPGMSGLDLLGEIKRMAPTTAVIVMTAFADVATARDALKRGAIDYLVKPFDNAELIALIAQIKAKRADVRKPLAALAGLVGGSAAMQKLYTRIERAAKSNASVLILGESGTGKELVARALHQLSPRSTGPFVEIDCTTLSDTLVESQLFGHERGAFTGAVERSIGRLEIAHGGTVFLDEIGELSLSLQPKLLRFLQEHRLYRLGGLTPIEVDVRVLAATNRDLVAAIKAGRFREDLFYRLDVLAIRVPPLRERRDDIPVLIEHFHRRRGAVEHPPRVSPEALELLQRYAWPGNVRELENVMERAWLEAGDGDVTPAHLPLAIARPSPLSVFVPPPSGIDDDSAFDTPAVAETTLDLSSNERQLIERALAASFGNKTQAAAMLGISRRRLYSRIQLLGIKTDESNTPASPGGTP